MNAFLCLDVGPLLRFSIRLFCSSAAPPGAVEAEARPRTGDFFFVAGRGTGDSGAVLFCPRPATVLKVTGLLGFFDTGGATALFLPLLAAWAAVLALVT